MESLNHAYTEAPDLLLPALCKNYLNKPNLPAFTSMCSFFNVEAFQFEDGSRPGTPTYPCPPAMLPDLLTFTLGQADLSINATRTSDLKVRMY